MSSSNCERRSLDCSFLGGESSRSTFWRVRGNGYLHLEHTVYLPPSPEPSGNPTPLCPQVIHWEGGTCLGGVKAITLQEGTWCMQLTPALLTSTCMLAHQSNGESHSKHQRPSSALCPFGKGPTVPHWLKKEPRTHPRDNKQLPGLPCRGEPLTSLCGQC